MTAPVAPSVTAARAAEEVREVADSLRRRKPYSDMHGAARLDAALAVLVAEAEQAGRERDEIDAAFFAWRHRQYALADALRVITTADPSFITDTAEIPVWWRNVVAVASRALAAAGVPDRKAENDA